MLELRGLRGLVILDEVQRRPELFPALRVLADERPRRQRFLVLGSAAPHLLKQTSETLAGRIAYLEGFILENVRTLLSAQPDECFFWRTEHGAELDFLVVRGRQRWGFEVKRTTAPAMTASMRATLADLKLDRLWVVHAGDRTFALGKRVTAVTWRDLTTRLPEG